jgi:phenylpyruvate tautomerase PptA (4-oxalocrotonate tautomerase family)
MPFLSLQTNATLTDDARSELAQALAELVSQELGKPLDYVQVHLQLGAFLTFAGTEEKTAFLDLRSLGLPPDKPPVLSAALCGLLQKQLGVAPQRVFLNFQDMPRSHWGWSGRTFG